MQRNGGFRDLIVWQKSMTLVEVVYSISRAFPNDERFGLTSQLRRAAVSVPANIAEGQGRSTRGEYLNLLSNARGSLKEVETLIELAKRLKFLTGTSAGPAEALCDEVSRMLTSLKRSLSRS
jgi:four helix bundle protein